MRCWVLGEFTTAEALLRATSLLRVEGFGDLDTYSPYPLHGGSDTLGLPPSRLPRLALLGGVSGVALAYGLQWYTAAVDYPLNVGNRPAHAPLSFVPITFELMVLFSALSVVFGLLWFLRLPRPHHPTFELERFRSASTHAFWVSVHTWPKVDAGRVVATLEKWGAAHVSVLDDEEPR